ncbi:putative protein SOSEKI [Helianthus annuus]|nr:putative protein SOSEKI [Helianthus annuus]
MNNYRPKSRKVEVVYYLCRNQQLEQPHFIEIPLVSPDGLYLRDVISKLKSMRGRGMASMYSWSCKRRYKNAFVWNDLCEDDIIVPANENEYVLKGSELLKENYSDCIAHARTTRLQTLQQLVDPSSSTNIAGRRTKISLDDDGYRSLATYRIYKCTHALCDAATQTDEHVKVQEHNARLRKTDTLESLMKADDKYLCTLEKLEEQQEQCPVPINTKLRESNMLLQLISCGLLSSQDHDFRQALSYNSRTTDSRPSSSLFYPFAMLGENNCLLESPRFTDMRLRLEDKEYLSGSSVET